LYCDIETGAVEGLEEDLGRVLAVLGRVQGLSGVSAYSGGIQTGEMRTGSVRRK
jgi:hypothetical protein